MNKIGAGVVASALALGFATSGAVAQTFAGSGPIIGDRALNDRISDVQVVTNRDLGRSSEDTNRYTFGSAAQGFTGSVALAYSGKSGNTETQDLEVAGKFTYASGPWTNSIGFALEFGEGNETDTSLSNVKTKYNAFLVYDVTRSFTDRFYVFGTARLKYDQFSSPDRDYFIGAGPGYRVINQDNMTWRLQAGPGVRYTKPNGANLPLNANDDDSGESEFAGIASSRFFYRFSDKVSLTNDTDVLFSDANTEILNDFGISLSVTNTLATRISYRTDYVSDPQPLFEHTDNTLGVSLVYTFR